MDGEVAQTSMQQQLSESKRLRGKNSRHGRVRFSPNSRARRRLGVLPPAALPGAPPADLGGGEGCILCCETLPSYVSVGECGHSDVCWVCSVRLRALFGDKQCPVCKKDSETVVLTNDVSAVSFEHRDLLQMTKDEELGLCFADTRIEHEVAALFNYQCALDKCENDGGCRFSSLQQLENHLWYVHWRQFCQTCLLDRPAFLCEQYAYCSHDMHRHCKEGDSSLDGMPALPAHPFCKFCKQHFYSEEEFHQHMHMTHHLCHICEKMGRQNEFYASWQTLALHYQQHHHVCAHADCMQNGFRLIAFATEEELHLHHLSEHHRGQGASERRMRLTVGQASYAESNPRHRRNVIPETDEIHFMWPAGATSRDSEMDSSSDVCDRLRQRYPNREISHQTLVRDSEPTQALEQLAASSSVVVLQLDDEQALDVQVEALELCCTIARSGPRCGTRCATDAISAVLSALSKPKSNTVSKAECYWQKSLRALSGAEAEALDHMRVHLEEVGNLGSTCNWEALERILALRPLFVRLLCQAQNSGRQREVIGPKGASQRGDAEQWLKWKMAAQSAVLALGDMERQCVAAYLKLCLERREGSSWLDEQKEAEMFPALGNNGVHHCASAGWVRDPPPDQFTEMQFPVLGNPVCDASKAGSAWRNPLQERRSKRHPAAVVSVASSEAARKMAAEKRAAERLARIAAARADFESRCVDHWEDWA